MDLLFGLYRAAPGAAMQFPSYLMLLAKRVIEAGFVQRIETPAGVVIGGMKSNPDYLLITEQGRKFIEELGLHEIA
jgi:hypothetical protein